MGRRASFFRMRSHAFLGTLFIGGVSFHAGAGCRDDQLFADYLAVVVFEDNHIFILLQVVECRYASGHTFYGLVPEVGCTLVHKLFGGGATGGIQFCEIFPVMRDNLFLQCGPFAQYGVFARHAVGHPDTVGNRQVDGKCLVVFISQ